MQPGRVHLAWTYREPHCPSGMRQTGWRWADDGEDLARVCVPRKPGDRCGRIAIPGLPGETDPTCPPGERARVQNAGVPKEIFGVSAFVLAGIAAGAITGGLTLEGDDRDWWVKLALWMTAGGFVGSLAAVGSEVIARGREGA